MKTTTEPDTSKPTPPPCPFPVGAKFSPYRLFTGLFIPEALARWDDLSPGAKLCYGRLARYAGKNGDCFPSVRTLASEIGVKRRQAQRYLLDLEEKGLIARREEIGKVTHYAFLWHDVFNQPVTYMTPVPDVTPPPKPHMTPKESQGKRVPDFDPDLDIDMPNRKNGASAAVSLGSAKPRRATKCKEHPNLRYAIASYGSGGGVGAPTAWPSHRLVLEVVRVANGADEAAIIRYLKHLWEDRDLRPDTDKGPKYWSWFVAVIKDAAENNKL